ELESWKQLTVVLEVRAEVAEGPQEKVDFLRKLASIWADRLGSAENAISAQSRALRAAPENDEARIELEELSEGSGALEKLAEIYALIASAAENSDLALAYYRRLAQLQERLENIDAAATAYEKALEIAPGDPEVLGAMDALFSGAGRWEELVGVYRRRIDLGGEPETIEAVYG